MDINQLTNGVNLDDQGREGVKPTSGGNKDFSTSVPSGYYLACLNRVATMGPITSMQSQGNGKSEMQTKEVMKIGFELLELVKPLDDKDKDFELTKEFKNEQGEIESYPYYVDAGGMFGIKRTYHEQSALPNIITQLQENLPFEVYEDAKKSHGTVQARFPTIKSMFGQQFIVYVQEFKSGGATRNEVVFTKGRAEQFTELNTANGAPKTVTKGIEVYAYDEADRRKGFLGYKAGTPSHKRAVLFDIGAKDMTQVNFDSIAQEAVYVGKDALAGHGDLVRYTTLVNLYSKLGKYKDMAFGELLTKGTIVLPEPTPFKDRTKESNDKEYGEEPTTSIKEVATTEPADTNVEQAESEFAV